MKLSNNSIREFAEGKPCQVRIPGVCNSDPTTSIMAHATKLPPTGIMGGKTDSDILATYIACSECHDLMDGRSRLSASHVSFDIQKDFLFYEYRAVVRTWRLILKEMTNGGKKI